MLTLESSSKRPKTSPAASASSSRERFDISLKQITQLPEDIQRQILPPETLARDILEIRHPESQSEEAGKQLVRFRFLEKHLPQMKDDWKSIFLRESIIKNHPAFFHFLFENVAPPGMPALLRTAVQSRNHAAFQALLNRTPVPLPQASLNETLMCLALYGQPEKLGQLLVRLPEQSRPRPEQIEKLYQLARVQQQKILGFSRLSPEEAKQRLFSEIEMHEQNQFHHHVNVVALLQHPHLDVNALQLDENDLEEDHEWLSPLQKAIKLNDMPLFKILLAEPRVSMMTPASETPLHTAAVHDRADMLKVLLARPDLQGLVNIRSDDQETPLHLAVWNGATEAVKVLVKKPELDVNVRAAMGLTPLHLFQSSASQREAVKMLLERPELDVNLPDRDGNTPLHIATELGDIELIQILMKDAPRLDVNARNLIGEMPLHRAVLSRHVGAVKTLLKAPQLNINARDEDGLTPLSTASCLDGEPEISELLRRHGATE